MKSRWRRGRRPTRRRRKSTATPCRRRRWICLDPILYGAARSTRSTPYHRLVARPLYGRFRRRTCRRNRCSWSAHKKKQKKHPTSTRLLARRPQKKIHLAARDDRARGGRVNCRRTRRTRHAPPLDLSPIFPLKYKTQTKIPRRTADATRLRGAIITFS